MCVYVNIIGVVVVVVVLYLADLMVSCRKELEQTAAVASLTTAENAR